ncbi:MAG: helix-turn-helix domain-containing protein [Candidatus Izemoplasmatales bacterium]
MRNRKIYLAMKNNDFEALRLIIEGYETLTATLREDGIVEITDFGFNETADYMDIRELAMQEFYLDFVAFVVPNCPDFDGELFLPLLRQLNPGIYQISDLIVEMVFTNHIEIKNYLKKYYYSLFGPETIETVLGFVKANQNACQAAKQLYMHRNTINYRLDHFIMVSEINVRSFKGGMAMVLLFR